MLEMGKKTTKRKRKPQAEYTQVDVIPPACTKCGSTERTGYHCVRTLESKGNLKGRPYTRIVWKRTICKACGQHRTDRVFENVTD